MKSDAEIGDDVINELYWDPQVTEPEAIGVAVRDGAVTLTGRVPSYTGKLAAARAAERVYGVKAVANDLKVQFSRAPRDDSDIARAIAHIVEWNVQIPQGKVHARVDNGWVTLDGDVHYAYQKREVERMVNHVRGWPGCGTSSPSGRQPARRPSMRRSSRRSSARPRSTRGTSRSRSPTTPRSSTGTCTRCGRRAPRRTEPGRAQPPPGAPQAARAALRFALPQARARAGPAG